MGVIFKGRTLLSLFILRLTRVHRWTDEMDEALVVTVVEIVAHGEAKQVAADALWVGLTASRRRMTSLAPSLTSEKCSEGKL